MISLLSVATATQSLSLGQALSQIFGSVSLTAWICLLIPQLITNYKNESAGGLSMLFLFVWLSGDIANLAGALTTDLAPTAIILATYFCFSDLVLISQCLYYHSKNARRRIDRQRLRFTAFDDIDSTILTEDEPLLARRRSSSLGSRLTTDVLPPRTVDHSDDVSSATRGHHAWVYNVLSLFGVWVIGILARLLSWQFTHEDLGPSSSITVYASSHSHSTNIGLLFGSLSALCYLCARIPQIVKNYRNKSCEGLSLLFFLLSLTGNATYGASVLAYSQDVVYLVKALPWILGSLGTMVEDGIIFVQFRMYTRGKEKAVEGEG